MIAAFVAAAAAMVAIDVGHTPSSPGSLGASGATEYSYNEGMARRVEAWLHRYGVSTRRVQPKNGNDLVGRARQSRGADLLLSIHHDSQACAVAIAGGKGNDGPCDVGSGRPRAEMADFRGYSAWVSGRNSDYAGSLRCAGEIAESLRNGGARPALYHALPLPGENRTLLMSNGVYRRDGLAVISVGPVRAVLVEVAVIANPAEERWIRRPEVADAFASFVAKGVARCLIHSPQF